jgi:hypothetical protein
MNDSNFIEHNGLEDNSPVHNTILATYYMFTTLSTVGFGDLYPVSNGERVLCILNFIMGNAIFSLILGNFIAIIDDYKMFMAEFEDQTQLNRFFSTLKYYNNHVDLP